MIRSPLGMKLNSAQPLREQIRQAASLGAKGVLVDAVGDLSPDRLSETGRRELRHLLRSCELKLIGVSLPTRRAFDSLDGLEARVARADAAFTMAYELGTALVLTRVGPVPPEDDAVRRPAFSTALQELAACCEHRGVRLAIETGTETGAVLAKFLTSAASPMLGASIDPGRLLFSGFDPLAAVRDLGVFVLHAFATDARKAARTTVIGKPHGFGFPPGALDWEEFLGALEEIGYRGFLTIAPDPQDDAAAEFKARAARFAQF